MPSNLLANSRHASRTGVVAQLIIFTVVAVAMLGVGVYVYYPSLSGERRNRPDFGNRR